MRSDQQTIGWGLLGMSRARLAQERVHEALGCLEEAVPFVGDHLSRLELYGQMSAAQIRLGQLERAYTSARAALLLATTVRPHSFSTLTGLSAATETLLALWALSRRERFEVDLETLQREVRRALVALRQFARIFTIGVPAYHCSEGLSCLITGDERAAIVHWREAQHAATLRRMPHQSARAAAWLSLAREHPFDPLRLLGIAQPQTAGLLAIKTVSIPPLVERLEAASAEAEPVALPATDPTA